MKKPNTPADSTVGTLWHQLHGKNTDRICKAYSTQNRTVGHLVMDRRSFLATDFFAIVY